MEVRGQLGTGSLHHVDSKVTLRLSDIVASDLTLVLCVCVYTCKCTCACSCIRFDGLLFQPVKI